MLTAIRLGQAGFAEFLGLEKCTVCRGDTGFVCNLTEDQRNLTRFEIMNDATPLRGDPNSPNALVAMAQAAQAVRVNIVPPARALDPLQRLQHAANIETAAALTPDNVAAIAHRVPAACPVTFNSVRCLGVEPRFTPLRGTINTSYHEAGGYINLVDDVTTPHRVLHVQSRLITKYVLEVFAALLLNANDCRLHFVDVGGRPDKNVAMANLCGITAFIGHMCPIIMTEDSDREDKTEKYVSGDFKGLACRCQLGQPSAAGIGYDTVGCEVCNPGRFARADNPDGYRMIRDDGATFSIPGPGKSRRIFFLNHVYQLTPEQLCGLTQSGDVLFSAHSFSGFSGVFEFQRGSPRPVREAEWERMGDNVTMSVEGGYQYSHSSHNFLREARSMNCAGYGCFKWSRVFTVGDCSIGADPMTPTKMGTTLWQLTKCNPSEVPVLDLSNFARHFATKVVTHCGTTFRLTRDRKEIQIIAEGVVNDSATISWECFDMVSRNHVAMSPGTANVYARSRSIVMPDIPSDKATLVMMAAIAYMRPALVAYASAVAADRVEAERIDSDLRGTPRVTYYGDIALGCALGLITTRTLPGSLAGGAFGIWAMGQARDLRQQGVAFYLQRNNISPTAAMLGGAVIMSGLNISGNIIHRSTAESFTSTMNFVVGCFKSRAAQAKAFTLPTDFSINAIRTSVSTNSAIFSDLVRSYWMRPAIQPADTGFSTLNIFLDTIRGSVAFQTVTKAVLEAPVEYKQYALAAGTLCAFTYLMNKRKPDRRPRGYWQGRVDFCDIMNPANLRPMTRQDFMRRGLFAGFRLMLMHVCPQQAQVILLGFVALDMYEARWLSWNIAHVTAEEFVKASMQRTYELAAARYGAPVILNMHCMFALFEMIGKLDRMLRTGKCPVLGVENTGFEWTQVLGSTLAVGLHCSIRNLPFHQREAIHTAWNLMTAWVSVCRGMAAGRSDIGKYVHDLGYGIYDKVKFGNILGGQAFLYDFDYPTPEMRPDSVLTEPDPYRYVAPKSKGLIICGPLLDPTIKPFCAPVAYTHANEKRAVVSRITMVTPQVDTTFFDTVFRPMALDICRHVFKDARVFPMERSDWLATLPFRRRGMLIQAFKDIDSDPWLLKYNNIGGKLFDPTKRKLFLKVEQTKFNGDGRAIQAGLDTTLANAGPWCMALCKLLRDVGDGETEYNGVRIIFGIGRDKTECYRLFFNRVAQGLKVVMITGDDVMVCDGEKLFSIDAKRWDAHTGEELLKLGNEIWKLLGVPKTILKNMMQGIKRNGKTVFGMFYARLGGTASGDPDTIQKNCLLGLLILLVTFCLLKPEASFSSTLDEIARKVGVVYEFVDDKGVDIGDIDSYHTLAFCSCFPVVLVDGTFGASPCIGKVLYRFGLAKPGHLPEVTLRSKALSLLAEARHSHFLTHYALCAYDAVGAGKYYVEERRYTEYATTLDLDADVEEEDLMFRRRYGVTLAEAKAAVTRIWDDAIAGEIVFTDPLIASIILIDT